MSKLFQIWFSFAFPSELLKGMAAVHKLLTVVAAVAGVSTGAAFAFVNGHIWSGFVVIIVPIIWFSLTAGMALVTTRGPSVTVGPVRLDKPNRCFNVPVKNGDTASTPCIKINSVVDSFGIKHIEHAWEGHWRGRRAAFNEEMIPDEEAEYGLLGIGSFESGNPTLFIYTREEAMGKRQLETGHNRITISRDLPLEKQGVTTVELVITCKAKNGEIKSEKNQRFQIEPDVNSPVGYKLTGILQKQGRRISSRDFACLVLRSIRSFRPAVRSKQKITPPRNKPA